MSVCTLQDQFYPVILNHYVTLPDQLALSCKHYSFAYTVYIDRIYLDADTPSECRSVV